jgi:hypothetical protein
MFAAGETKMATPNNFVAAIDIQVSGHQEFLGGEIGGQGIQQPIEKPSIIAATVLLLASSEERSPQKVKVWVAGGDESTQQVVISGVIPVRHGQVFARLNMVGFIRKSG